MRRDLWTVGSVAVTLFLSACADDDRDDSCPSRNANATWSTYGRLRFNLAGRDTTAWSFVNQCGWHVHGGHAGGIGDTLQVAPPRTVCEEQLPRQEDSRIADECADAVFLFGFPFRGSGNTRDATSSPDDPQVGCGFSGEHGHSVWYGFRAAADGFVILDTRGSDYDTILSLFEGECTDDLTLVRCNDDALRPQSELIAEVSVGQTYRILITSYTEVAGRLVLNAAFSECRPVDESVILVWAFNEFYGYRLGPGWGGSTDRGVRMGASVDDLLSAHPGFVGVGGGRYRLVEGDDQVSAQFNEAGELSELIVGQYFRR